MHEFISLFFLLLLLFLILLLLFIFFILNFIIFFFLWSRCSRTSPSLWLSKDGQSITHSSSFDIRRVKIFIGRNWVEQLNISFFGNPAEQLNVLFTFFSKCSRTIKALICIKGINCIIMCNFYFYFSFWVSMLQLISGVMLRLENIFHYLLVIENF